MQFLTARSHYAAVAFWFATAASLLAAAGEPEVPAYSTTVVGSTDDDDLTDDRATSTVTKRDMERRLPRSAPDALRYEPGVFVQQTGHGQGSTYLRGLTGQQTLMLFDGVRMNNSVYRQGPNQYFFTLDSRTIRAIEVQRGGGSTRWGSDALGGVIDAHPIEPTLSSGPLTIEPEFFARGATADQEWGGRAALNAAWALDNGVAFGFVGGLGGRRVGKLRGPPVRNPNPNTERGLLPWVPLYEEYRPLTPVADQLGRLRTQHGTGFDEVTGDGRLVVQLAPDLRLTAAGYVYHEYNAPRTDQCPPPTAPTTECLMYEEQFRHLAYARLEHRNATAWAQQARITLSWQEQHERRRRDLTSANLRGLGIDDVETWGVRAQADTSTFQLAESIAVTGNYGIDTYGDWVRSRAQHTYTDTHDTVLESRGQYINNGLYVYGGTYADATAQLGAQTRTHGGVRASWVGAHADADKQSGTQAVRRFWAPVVGHVGVEMRVVEPLTLLANYDNSFRAPNLDDMTSRQQTGPGFQFENAALNPERAHTFEVGARLRLPWLQADAWVYETYMQSAILKVTKTIAECPANTPQCQGSWSRFQLQNSPSYAEIRGVEGAFRFLLPWRFVLRSTATYTWTEGPRVGIIGYGGYGVVLGKRVPLSKTPPFNGTVELGWSSPLGLGAGVALQWARAQTRLAIADYGDGRIPKYGTPGYAVLQVRASYRIEPWLYAAVVVENVFDSPYRFHGSSVNGAERGVVLQIDVKPLS